jgi:hypothetical protein
VFWVISVYFNIRNTLPKSSTFLLGHSVYEVLTSVAKKIHIIWHITPENQQTFRGNMFPPYLRPKNNPCCLLISCLAFSFSLKMEMTCSSETSVTCQLHVVYNSQDTNLQIFLAFGLLLLHLSGIWSFFYCAFIRLYLLYLYYDLPYF